MRSHDSRTDHARSSNAAKEDARPPGRSGPASPAAAVPGRAVAAVQLRVTAGGGAGVDMQAAASQGTSGAAGRLPFLDQIQRAFGRHDVGGIQAHTDGNAAAAARSMNAEAFATGDRVAFGGAPSLHTAAHEAAHVVQQRAGVHLKGGVGAAGDEYERHADAVADRVVAGASAEALLDTTGGGGAHSAVQHVIRNNGNNQVIDDYDLDNLTHAEAVFLDNQINQLRVWSADPADLVKIANALQAGPGEDEDDDEGEDGDEDGDEDGGSKQKAGELANLENRLRTLAKTAGGKDSSGHGKGKKIKSGHSKDRHQNGQKRKVQHKTAKVGSLQEALEAYRKAGGTAGDLAPSTVKLLNKSGVSWRGYLEPQDSDDD